jgi:hypothetical protein
MRAGAVQRKLAGYPYLNQRDHGISRDSGSTWSTVWADKGIKTVGVDPSKKNVPQVRRKNMHSHPSFKCCDRPVLNFSCIFFGSKTFTPLVGFTKSKRRTSNLDGRTWNTKEVQLLWATWKIRSPRPPKKITGGLHQRNPFFKQRDHQTYSVNCRHEIRNSMVLLLALHEG